MNIDDSYRYKELLGIPWRLALELQRLGWHWRAEIVWSKASTPEQDFRLTFAEVQGKDVVYCDPPYVGLSDTANFTDYASGGFDSQDQRELAALCTNAARQGATALISNHDTPFTRELYKDASEIVPLLVSRTISCKGDTRKKAKELIAIYRPECARWQRA